MLKKITLLVTTMILLFTLGTGVWAEGKTVYIEYETEKDAENFGPTLGFEWQVNDKWTISFSHQLKDDANEATSSLGAEYALLENLSAGISFDTAKSEDSMCLELSGSYSLSEPWALTGGIAYTDYWLQEEEDYNELELSVGMEYQASEALLTSLSYVWTDPSEDDSFDKFVLGAEYGLGNFGIYGEYEIPEEGYTLTIGVAYNF